MNNQIKKTIKSLQNKVLCATHTIVKKSCMLALTHVKRRHFSIARHALSTSMYLPGTSNIPFTLGWQFLANFVIPQSFCLSWCCIAVCTSTLCVAEVLYLVDPVGSNYNSSYISKTAFFLVSCSFLSFFEPCFISVSRCWYSHCFREFDSNSHPRCTFQISLNRLSYRECFIVYISALSVWITPQK